MTQRTLALHEYTTASSVALDPAERDHLASVLPDLRIAPTPGTSDRYDLWPGSTVGVVRLGDLTVEIRPRLPVDRVLFLASYSIGSFRWPVNTTAIEQAPDLLEAVARLFVRLVEPALSRGILQGYVRTDDRLQTFRGRLRFADQISRWNGRVPPVEVTYDDFTVDIIENQLLKTAALRLASIGGRSPTTARELQRVSFRLQDVSTPSFGATFVPEVGWTRLNEHYRDAVELARLVLHATGLEAAQGTVAAPSFLLNMAEVFERFVHRALRESLGLSEDAFPQNAKGKHLRLDHAGHVVLKPDLSWWAGTQCLFVGDCKYKRTDNAITHADLYQLLAYATATDLPGGVLVYAAGEAEPTTHVVCHAGKELVVRTLDLRGSPADALAQIDELAEVVRELSARSQLPRTHAPGRAQAAVMV